MRTPQSASSKFDTRLWMRVGSILISFASVTLLVAAFGARFYRESLSSILLGLVLVALCMAIFLHARFLILARREHHETASALDATEREFKSIFDNALDAIVILDDRGICLEANPAAQTLFGVRYYELVGEPIGNLRAGEGVFLETWKAFLERKYEHGETRLSRKDGSTIFVEYTAKADYLPGKHVAVLRDITRRKQAEGALRESEGRFQQMAGNIQEIFWMLDRESKQVLYVNQAYETITGRSCETLRDNPTSYRDLIHPQERVRVLSRLDETVRTGQFDEEFRILRPDGAIRWVWVRGFPVRDAEGVVRSLVGTGQDISARKSAEAQMARNLDMAESARAEAEAFRRTTLALTQNLSMDYVLDTLLQSLLTLIPCESARVLLLEADTRLLLAREVQHYDSNRGFAKSPATLDARDSRFLMQVLATRSSLLIPDTSDEQDWTKFSGHSQFRSWLCVPLATSQEMLGLLSLGHTRGRTFTQEHLRLAKSLAIPAAVAIQNARLYERAGIYGAELKQRLADLEQIQDALREAEENRASSEEKFRKIFHSSPVAISITTVGEGRFVEANGAFERRYGYSREELLGRTAVEIEFWGDPTEREQMISKIRKQGHVRNWVTRFRKSSGEPIDTACSFDTVEFDGQQCILVVSADLSEQAESHPSFARNAAPAP
jgi:PAS domain S-box-containing protein